MSDRINTAAMRARIERAREGGWPTGGCGELLYIANAALDEIDRLRLDLEELDFLNHEGGPHSVSAMGGALRWIFEHAADQDISHEAFRIEAANRAAAVLLSDMEAGAALKDQPDA